MILRRISLLLVVLFGIVQGSLSARQGSVVSSSGVQSKSSCFLYDTIRRPFLPRPQCTTPHGRLIVEETTGLSLLLRGGSQDIDEDIEDDEDESDGVSQVLEAIIADDSDDGDDAVETETETTPITETEESSTPASDNQEEENDDDEEEDKDDEEDAVVDENAPIHSALSKEPVLITISTMLKQPLLDQVIELNVQRSRTVSQLKESLQRSLPGKPPVTAMQLRLGPRILDDDILVDELIDDEEEEEEDDEEDTEKDMDDGPKSRATLVLDMIPPVDPKALPQLVKKLADMTPSEILDAYAINEAAVYQNAALVLNSQGDPSETPSEETNAAAEATPLPSLLTTSTTTLLKDHAAKIREDLEAKLLQSQAAKAILAETVPPSHKILNHQEKDIRGQRVRHVAQGGVHTTLRRKIQRNLNINWAATLKHFMLFLFFGYFGGRSPTSRAILFLGAPSVILLQARVVKLILRQLVYTVFYHPPNIVLSLLPAPQQAILSFETGQALEAVYGKYLVGHERKQYDNDNDDGEEDDGSDGEYDMDGDYDDENE